MLTYGLTQKDKEQLEIKKNLYTGFGRDGRDYIHLYVYQSDTPDIDDNDVLIKDEIFPLDVVEFQDDKTMDLDIGTHLRAMGFESGTHKVKYLFLRRLAGKDEVVFVNENGEIHTNRVQTKVINGTTRYYATKKFGKRQSRQQLKEIFPKDLKYVIKKISGDRTELEVDCQEINNNIYKKNFREINKIINYTPTTLVNDSNTGTIRFDLTDPTILIANLDKNDRGFTDSMVGGEITIKGVYSITSDQLVIPEIPPIDLSEPLFTPQDFQPTNNILERVVSNDPPSIPELVDEKVQDYEDGNYDNDRYGSVCFHGDTRVKLSNNRSVPIKMIRPGMKVKTEQGYAKVLKVVKDGRPDGERLVKFGRLITTDNHPIKYRGQWYMAKEVGKLFQSKSLEVWNLILDKHHTIYANNVVSATLGKWDSIEQFLYQKNHRINMLRAQDEDYGGGSTGGGGGGGSSSGEGEGDSPGINIPTRESIPNSNAYQSDNEIIVDDIVPSVTREFLEDNFAVSRQLPNPVPPPPPATIIPIDYKARIVEVLDYNRVRVDISYEQGATNTDHSGEDTSKDIYQEFMVQFTKSQIKRLNSYLVINGTYNLITNIKDNPNGTSRFIKVYSPIVDDIEEMDLCYFVDEKMEPYRDIVELVPFVEEEEEVLFLRLPDFNSVNNPINMRSTNFNNFDQLVGSDTTVSQDIQNQVLSQSLLDVQVNVDYTKRTDAIDVFETDFGFGNFVTFGSAEKRINNFKKKLDLIQTYTSSSLALNDVTGSARTRTEFDNKKRRVINSFDPYEHFLYFESSSAASSSIGEFYEASWPKENSTEPYILSHTSSSAATTWYNTWTGYAKSYDRLNRERLINNLPLHVTADTENNFFLDFMDMIGQQFDEIFVYTRHFTDINERTSKLSEGISKDIVREVAKSVGIDVVNGNDLLILPQYLLGKDSDGTDLFETPQEKVTEEIWKRILANTPFFLKTKGTVRALKGLMNCYGIPSSILRVREYGGPDKGTRVSYEIKRKFTYALDFKSSEYLRLPWKDDSNSMKPQTVEFRFRSPISKDQVLLHKGTGNDSWAIQLQDNGQSDDYGYLQFSLSSSVGMTYITSSLQPFYNDDMWSVMLTRKSSSGADLTADTHTQKIKYELTSKQYDSTREVILYQTSESVVLDGSTSANAYNNGFVTDGDILLGGSGSSGYFTDFSGSMMEFRLWNEVISQSVFDNHVRAPKSYNGNTTSSYYDNLLFRVELNNNVNLQTFPSASQDTSNAKLYHTSASAHDFTGNNYRSIVDKEQLKVPNLGPQRRNATKIRIEDTTLTGPLSSNIRREKSSQDFAPVDSNKLGVYFSPTDIVNEDIVYSIANFDFDNQVGDPRDQYKLSYRGLTYSQNQYWKKYSRTNNFWDYMRIINYYDNSLWTQLRNLTPARANATLGLLIEPNILERSKEIVGQPPEFTNEYFENAGHFDFGLQITDRVSGSSVPFGFSGEFKMFGQGITNTKDGTINLHNTESGSLGNLGLPSLVHLNEINPRSEFSTTYATASITFGGTNTEFTETVQPFISASRLSEHNEIKRKIYTSSLDALTDTPFSSSFEPAEFQSMAYESNLFRLFYKGQLLTKDNTIDGKDPVEITITSPTKLVTQEPGESKLKVE